MTEKFVRYSDDFNSLWEAWDFVIGHAGEFSMPNVAIQPYEILHGDLSVETVQFTATVSGCVE